MVYNKASVANFEQLTALRIAYQKEDNGKLSFRI